MTPYQDNIEQHNLQEDIDDAIEFLRQHAMHIALPQWEQLKGLGKRFESKVVSPEVIYDANFSMADELQSQIQAVRAVRERIMTRDGQLMSDITTREAKEVISSGSTLLGTLMKFHEKIQNMERLRLLETAVVEVLEETSEEVKEQVLVKMEEKLANLA